MWPACSASCQCGRGAECSIAAGLPSRKWGISVVLIRWLRGNGLAKDGGNSIPRAQIVCGKKALAYRVNDVEGGGRQWKKTGRSGKKSAAASWEDAAAAPCGRARSVRARKDRHSR